MKIKTLIVDDAEDARVAMELLVMKYFKEDVNLLPSVSSVKDAIESINSNKPQLVLLDIEMPEENGFQIFDYFKDGHDFEVIFITGHHKYAVEAFRYDVLDYLIKPIDRIQLDTAIKRFKSHTKTLEKHKIDTIINKLANDQFVNKKIMFPSKDGYQLEKINEIIYCKADGAFSSIYTLNEKPFITTASLKNLEELLPPEIFFRIHKSYLINLNHVKKYDKKNTKIFLENNYELDVAVRRANEFLRLLTIK